MSDVTLWHNPSCGSSRNALDHLKGKGIEPEIYLYLKEKPDAAALRAVLKRLGLRPSGLLRPKEPIGDELGLYAEDAEEETILAAMASHAILIQRPIVLTPTGAVIARPKTKMDAIL
jgi:arsenate reductase